MFREAQRSVLAAILELWVESTTWGHRFLKANYWGECIPLVRIAYLANAQNWVWEEHSKLLGFVSLMEGRFLAAMFVAPKAVRRGIGKRLMQYVQQRHPHLMLEVYQKNQPAIVFYQAQGFHIVDFAWQDET
ncbi:N-acetyltransferase, partial [Escherichia coli]|uniref:N-acetyltransferase n=1 Tax=Escherichia coli TaxID=562 RepID=UPI002FD512A2